MTRCRKCDREHKGPRSLDDLLREGGHVLAVALEMVPERALEYLRTQWLGGALEIQGCCADCVIATLAVSRIELKEVANGAAFRELPDPPLEPGVVLARVLPMRRPSKDSAARFDNERKP